MLVYYGNIQCISARELIDGGYITESCYRNWVNRGRIKVVRRGGGAAGNCALVALNSLPTECLERVKEVFVFCALTGLSILPATELQTNLPGNMR